MKVDGGCLLFWCLLLQTHALKSRKIHVTYPVELLAPFTGSRFAGNVTNDKLTCFGNRDYGAPTYKDALLCLIQMYAPFPYNCHSIWGSRPVIVESVGSIEFLKVSRLPSESPFDEHVAMNATRWLELPTSDPHLQQKEEIWVPAEPLYLCVRANSWQSDQEASFSVQFRSVRMRDRDREECRNKAILHIALLAAVSSVWLLPYLISLVVAVYAYSQGIKVMLVLIAFSSFVVCLTPLMLTSKNRHLAGHYISYFLPGVKEEETLEVMRRRLPVFQAVFFSSIVVCVGSAGSYILYSYFGIDREYRNMMLKASLGFAASWFVFFLCRSLERFCRDWIWIVLAIGLAKLLDSHLNSLCHDEIAVATMVITFVLKSMFINILHLPFFTSLRKSLPVLEPASPLPPAIQKLFSNSNQSGKSQSNSISFSGLSLPKSTSSSVFDSTTSTPTTPAEVTKSFLDRERESDVLSEGLDLGRGSRGSVVHPSSPVPDRTRTVKVPFQVCGPIRVDGGFVSVPVVSGSDRLKRILDVGIEFVSQVNTAVSRHPQPCLGVILQCSSSGFAVLVRHRIEKHVVELLASAKEIFDEIELVRVHLAGSSVNISVCSYGNSPNFGSVHELTQWVEKISSLLALEEDLASSIVSIRLCPSICETSSEPTQFSGQLLRPRVVTCTGPSSRWSTRTGVRLYGPANRYTVVNSIPIRTINDSTFHTISNDQVVCAQVELSVSSFANTPLSSFLGPNWEDLLVPYLVHCFDLMISLPRDDTQDGEVDWCGVKNTLQGIELALQLDGLNVRLGSLCRGTITLCSCEIAVETLHSSNQKCKYQNIQSGLSIQWSVPVLCGDLSGVHRQGIPVPVTVTGGSMDYESSHQLLLRDFASEADDNDALTMTRALSSVMITTLISHLIEFCRSQQRLMLLSQCYPLPDRSRAPTPSTRPASIDDVCSEDSADDQLLNQDLDQEFSE